MKEIREDKEPEITKVEIRKAVEKLKNGKAVRDDGIKEIWKYGKKNQKCVLAIGFEERKVGYFALIIS